MMWRLTRLSAALASRRLTDSADLVAHSITRRVYLSNENTYQLKSPIGLMQTRFGLKIHGFGD